MKSSAFWAIKKVEWTQRNLQANCFVLSFEMCALLKLLVYWLNLHNEWGFSNCVNKQTNKTTKQFFSSSASRNNIYSVRFWEIYKSWWKIFWERLKAKAKSGDDRHTYIHTYTHTNTRKHVDTIFFIDLSCFEPRKR